MSTSIVLYRYQAIGTVLSTCTKSYCTFYQHSTWGYWYQYWYRYLYVLVLVLVGYEYWDCMGIVPVHCRYQYEAKVKKLEQTKTTYQLQYQQFHPWNGFQYLTRTVCVLVWYRYQKYLYHYHTGSDRVFLPWVPVPLL